MYGRIVIDEKRTFFLNYGFFYDEILPLKLEIFAYWINYCFFEVWTLIIFARHKNNSNCYGTEKRRDNKY